MHLSDSRRRPVLRAASAQALLFAVAALLLLLAAPLAARADGDDPNGVGVARLSLVDGSVAVQRGDSSAPIDAAVNAPVLAADYVTTGDASHAEVQFDGMSTVRLGDNVQMRLTRIDPGNRQIQLAQGTIELRLLQGTDGENDIDTPSVSVHPLDTGSYRVTVDSDGRSVITVRSGRAEVVTPQGNQVVGEGGALLAQGPASSPQVQTIEAVAIDDFDNFNRDRDQREAPALASAPYVDPQVPGIADLNADGRWQQDNSYGQVWVPSNVAADWAPYRDGRWVWEDYYGWTWVGYEPWGWAPYHYGRWYHSAAYGWAWYPGPRGVASVWSPALVAFIGFGGGGEISLGFGNIGWVPLAPYEAFHPWWGRGVSTGYNEYNGRGYRNAQYNGATYVSHERFLQGRFDHASPMTVAQMREGQVVRGTLPVVPTRANLRFNDRTAPANLAVRATFAQRPFAGRANVVQRTPFEQQRASFAGGAGARPSASFNGGAGARPSSTAPSGAWSRFETARPAYNGERPTYNAQRPAYNANAARSGDTTYRRTEGNTNTYQRPSYNQGTNAYQRPSTYNQGANTYQRPSYNQGTNAYQRPSTYNQGANTYQRPSYNQGTNTYQRPTYNQGGNTYQRPTYNQGGNTYQRPTYNQGGNTYQRPTYNQGGNTYQRPTYNQGGNTYQRPTYNRGSTPAYRQPSYSRPAQTYQRQPQRTQQDGSRQASPRPSERQH